jgi:hypothetical protein
VIGLGVGVAMLAGLLAAFLGGRRTGRNGLFWSMEHDTQFRRDLLDKLAGLEGVRIVGRGE